MRASSLAAVALLLGGSSVVPADSQATAVVTARSAEFFIPVAHDGLWRWYRATTEDNDLEYDWRIGVSSRGVDYELGFSLFKFPGKAEGRGDLAQLLKAGQASLWRRETDSGSLVAGAKVSVVARDGGVVIRVPDEATVRLLFADRPATAKVIARTPDMVDNSKVVSISYRE